MANTKTNKKTKVRKRINQKIEKGQVHITTSFNNTIVSFTDMTGGVVSQC